MGITDSASRQRKHFFMAAVYACFSRLFWAKCRNQALTLKFRLLSVRAASGASVNNRKMSDVTSVERSGTCTIQEPGANAGENPAASLNDLVGPSSNF